MSAWFGPAFFPKRYDFDAAMTTSEVDFVPQTLYWERQALIEALENWIPTLESLCAH